MDGATSWKTPISCSAIDKNPMSGYLFEGNPVDEGTTRRGTDPLMLKFNSLAFWLGDSKQFTFILWVWISSSVK